MYYNLTVNKLMLFSILFFTLCLAQDQVLLQNPQGFSDAFMAYKKGKEGGQQKQNNQQQQQQGMNPMMWSMMGMDMSDMLPFMMMRNQMANKNGQNNQNNGGGFGGFGNNPFMMNWMMDNPEMFLFSQFNGGRQGGRQATQGFTDSALLMELMNKNNQNNANQGGSQQQTGPFGGSLGPMLWGDLSPKDVMMAKLLSGDSGNAAPGQNQQGNSGGLSALQAMLMGDMGSSDGLLWSMLMNKGGNQNQQQSGRMQTNPNATNIAPPQSMIDPSIFSAMSDRNFLAYQALNGKVDPYILSQLINGEMTEFTGVPNKNGVSAGPSPLVSDIAQNAAKMNAMEAAGITDPRVMGDQFEGQYLETKTFQDLTSKGVDPVMAADLAKYKSQQYKTLAGLQKPGIANPWIMKELMEGEFLKYQVVESLVTKGINRAVAESMADNQDLQFQVVNNMVKKGEINAQAMKTIMDGEFMKMKEKQAKADLINAALAGNGLPTTGQEAAAAAASAVAPQPQGVETPIPIVGPTLKRQTREAAQGFADSMLAMKFMQQMQQQQQQKNAANSQGGNAQGGISPLAAMFGGDMGSDMTDLMMMRSMFGNGNRNGQGKQNGGGMNPLMGAAMMDNSDLWLWSMMNRNKGGARHARQQYPMMGAGMGGYTNPMTSMLMADAMTGNDLLGNDAVGTMMLLNGMSQPPMMGMGAPPMMGAGMGMGGYNPYAGAAGGMAYAQPTTQNYYQPQQSYGGRPSNGRKRGASQYGVMPGMGMGMPGAGMGGMHNMLWLDAMSGGDLMNNDLAQDLGSMMVMNSMMRPPAMGAGMMGGMSMYGGYPAAGGMYPSYYYGGQVPGQTNQQQPAADTTSSGGFGSRIKDKIKGKRGSTNETPVGDAGADAGNVVDIKIKPVAVSDTAATPSDKSAPAKDAVKKVVSDKKVE